MTVADIFVVIILVLILAVLLAWLVFMLFLGWTVRKHQADKNRARKRARESGA